MRVSLADGHLLILIISLLQYPFTTVIPNLGVWVPPQVETDSLDGAGSEGLVLCVSEMPLEMVKVGVGYLTQLCLLCDCCLLGRSGADSRSGSRSWPWSRLSSPR